MIQTKSPNSEQLIAQATVLLSGERDAIANAANLAAFILHSVADVNWSGFYFVRSAELVLGPFAGKPAVTRIAHGRGVCGAAWAQARTLLIDDVREFPEHIACDSASQAEIVVPLVRAGSIFGALDCDSPVIGRFGGAQRLLFERMATLYVASSDPLEQR